MTSKMEGRQKQRRTSLDFSAFRRPPKMRQRRRFSQESLASMDSCSYGQSLNNSSSSLKLGFEPNLDDSNSTRSSRSSCQTGRSSAKDYGYEDVMHKSQTSPDAEEEGQFLYAPYGRSNSLSMVLFGRKSSMTGANPGSSASPSPTKKISPTSVLADLFSHGANHGSSHKRDGSDVPDAKKYQKLGGMSICLDEIQGNEVQEAKNESIAISRETSESETGQRSIGQEDIASAHDNDAAQYGSIENVEDLFLEDELHREAFLNATEQVNLSVEQDEDVPEASVYEESVSCFDDETDEEDVDCEDDEMGITEHSLSTANNSLTIVVETVDSNMCNVTGEDDSSSSKHSSVRSGSNTLSAGECIGQADQMFSLDGENSQGEDETTVVFDDNSDSDETSLNVAQIQDVSEHSQSSDGTSAIRRRNSGSLKDFRAVASSNRADSLRDFRTIYNQREDEATESSSSMADLTMYSSVSSMRSESILSRATSLSDGSTRSVRVSEKNGNVDTEVLLANGSFDDSQASSINSLANSQNASSHQTSSQDSRTPSVLGNLYSVPKEERSRDITRALSSESVEEFSASIDEGSTDDSSMHLLEQQTDDDESFAYEEEVITEDESVIEEIDSEGTSIYYEEIVIEDDESSYEEVLVEEDATVELETVPYSVEEEDFSNQPEKVQKEASLYSINSTSQTQRQSGSMRGDLRSSSERSRERFHRVDTQENINAHRKSPSDDALSIMDYIMHDSRHPRSQYTGKQVQFGSTVKRRICLFRQKDAPKKLFDIAPSLATPSHPKRGHESKDSYNLLSKTGYSSFCRQTLGKEKSRSESEDCEWDRLQRLLRGTSSNQRDIEEDTSFEFGNMSPSVDEAIRHLSRAHRSKCRFWFSRLYFSTTQPPSEDSRVRKLQNITELALPQLAHWYDLPLHTMKHRSKNSHLKRNHSPNLQGSDSSLVYEMETNSYTETTKSITSNSSWDGSRIVEIPSPKPVSSDSKLPAMERGHTLRGLERIFCNDLLDKIQFLHVQKVLKVQASFDDSITAEAAVRKASRQSSGPSRHMAEQLGKYDTFHALRAVLTPWDKPVLGYGAKKKSPKKNDKPRSPPKRNHSIQLYRD